MTNPAASNQKKISAGVVLILVLFFILLIGGVIYFFFFRNNQASQTATDTEPAGEPVNWSKEETLFYASSILGWMNDNMRDERGAYNAFYNCEYDLNGELVCNNSYPSNRTGAPVLWANYAFWQATGDARALQRLKNGLAVYNNRELVEVIQTNNLSCYYLAIIANNPNLSELDRNNARQICFDTEYEYTGEGEAAYTYLNDTNLIDTHRTNTETVIASILSQQPPVSNENVDNQAKSELVDNLWATWSADYAARYSLDQSNATLEKALFFYAGALTYYQHNPDSNINHKCELLLASSEFCKLATNESDLNCQFTSWLGEQLRQQPLGEKSTNFEALAKCALADDINREHYLSFMRSYYQSPDNAYYQNTKPIILNDYQSVTKNVVTNALFAGLLVGK